jgi:NADH:ubiquinone oxidoreductase subunit 6 (subunit J)
MKLIEIFLLCFLVFFINKTLSVDKTAYLLVLSIFIFLLAGALLFFLELEFLAVSFVMVYVGGIAIIFIFLIIVLEARLENTVSFLNNYS